MLLSFHFSNYQIASALNRSTYSHRHLPRLSALSLPSKPHRKFHLPFVPSFSADVSTTSTTVTEEAEENDFEFSRDEEKENYNFDASPVLTDSKRFDSPVVEVKKLEDLPEQWMRSRLAWLCEELPAHSSGAFIRVLNAQRTWVRQDDCAYIAAHCMRIRESEAAFRIYAAQ